MYFMLNNKKWLTIIEIIISITIMIIFYLWFLNFLIYKNIFVESLDYDYINEVLYNEVQVVLKNYDFDSLEEWKYILYYTQEDELSLTWSYKLDKILNENYDFNSSEIYMIDKLWFKKPENIEISQDYFLRIIEIKNIISPFVTSWTNLKKVNVDIKNYNCLDKCFFKSFYLINNLNYYD